MIEGRTDIVKDPFSTITARNVPFKATEAEIVHFFGQAGKVGVRGVLDCSLLSPPDHEGCYQWVQECSREFDCMLDLAIKHAVCGSKSARLEGYSST